MRMNFINLAILFSLLSAVNIAISEEHHQGHAHPAGVSAQPPMHATHQNQPGAVHQNQPHGGSTSWNHGSKGGGWGGNSGNGNNSWHHGHHNHNNQVFFFSTYPYYPYYYPSYAPAYSPPADNDYYPAESDYTSAPEYSNPSGTWVTASGGAVPEYAVVASQDNGNNVYYCRVQYNNQTYYGTLVINDACYVDDSANAVTMRFDNYQVLVQ